MHSDAVLEWDTIMQDLIKAKTLREIERIALLPDDRAIERGIEELYFHLTGIRLGDPDARAGLWVIIHAVFAKRLLNELKGV